MTLIKKASELEINSTIKMMIYGQAGMGKAQPLYCQVLTPHGYKKLADISIGDKVMGKDGKIQEVIGVYPQGVRPVYKVTTNDGAVTYCDEEHIWNVRASSGNSRKAGFKNLTLKEMLSKGIVCKQTPREERTGRKAMPRFEIPVADAMEFPKREYEVSPYILGVLIGDGSLTGSVALFSNPDIDNQIAETIKDILPCEYELKKNDAPDCPQYSIVLKGDGEGYIQRLKRLGLNVKSGDKFIPDIYKYGSKDQRLSLLRGLMDTDGFAYKNRIYFSTSSKMLAYDIVELVNSLGGIANVHVYEREDKSDEYRVSIKIKICPFSLRRKAVEWNDTKVSRYIIDATRIDDYECVCIKVSNDDELYVTDNYIVTHNTTVALSSPSPLLIDFDGGVKRVNMNHLQGVDIVQVSSWAEVQQLFQEDLSAYRTIVIDTIGKMMDFIISYKCGSKQPSIRDWGGINQEFQSFTRNLSNLGKHIIFVAHRDTRKNGDDTVFIPSLREKNYNSIVTELDLLGYLEMRSDQGVQRRTITFDPTSVNDGKNTCGLPSIMNIPTIIDRQGNVTQPNNYITEQVIKPYNDMLHTKQEAIQRYTRTVEEIRDAVELITDALSANSFAAQIKDFDHVGSSLQLARTLFAEKVKALGLEYDKESKQYKDPQAA